MATTGTQIRAEQTNGRAAAKRTARPIARVASLGVAFFFVLHAIAHAVAVVGIFGIGKTAKNTTTYLLTGLDPSSAAFKAFGVLWLVALVLFVVAAAGIVLRRAWWTIATGAAAGLSLVLCILWKDNAIVGLVINVIILVGLAVYLVVRRSPNTAA